MFNATDDNLIRFLTIAVFIIWTLYWLITERKADKEKPKVRKIAFLHKDNLRKLALRFAEGLLIFQVLGLPLLQIPNATSAMQIVGLAFIVVGASISISSRKSLGTNWAHAFEYQVKSKQELVTSGIYKFIRHPIYAGVILGFIGGELVAKSYLVFIVLILIPAAYHQAELEEKLLIRHFGEDYKKYMKRSKMLIPYLW